MNTGKQLEVIRKKCRKYLDISPVSKDVYLSCYEESYKPGALDSKTKKLMALCGALVSGCAGCILGQAEMAIKEGATAQEILETCAVAVSLGGTMAWSETSLVVGLLEENGLID